MVHAIYVNLPVADLERSKLFWESLGFGFDLRFTNEQAAALMISESIFAMLHTPESFRRFTTKEVADARRTTEVLLALQVGSRKAADELADKAIAAGGRQAREPADRGFMYERAFEDLDGHVWEVFWLDAGGSRS